ncbi:H394 [Gammaproteobacteria bacterium]
MVMSYGLHFDRLALTAMRLTKKQTDTVRRITHEIFGQATRIWLFGSRVDDKRRGGDYDFYLQTTLTDPADIVQRKLDLLVRLHDTPEFEDEKIDLVVRPYQEQQELPIYLIAQSEGLEL